jgi:IclR family transcriptional regulator, pca regulon regulatory protein
MPKTTMSNVEIDERYFVETAARTLLLLQAVAAIDAPAPLTVIVERLGWSKPAVYRLVRTLEAIGALRQEDGKGYVLGPMLITLGLSALQATGLVGVARPHLERLHAEVEETVVLTVLDGREVVYVDRIEADKILIPRTRLGSRLPAYCTSTGQVLLSGLSDEDVHRRLDGESFDRVAPNTLETLAELMERLADIRRMGYCVQDEELTIGHRSAAAPVRDHTGTVAAAVSVSVPTARVTRQQLIRFATEALVPTAEAISLALGGIAAREIAALAE